jgi:MFS family permease
MNVGCWLSERDSAGAEEDAMTEQQVRTTSGGELDQSSRKFLFWACFVALVTTSFAFIIRVMVMGEWQVAFGLSETQKGEIFGAGLWPFGLTIVLFSLVVDKIGYGRSMIFAFLCHLVSTVLLFSAQGYWSLYFGSVLNGLAAGTVEAVINPAVASLYPREKTKMLTKLHAGWPGGMVVGGLMLMLMGPQVSWTVKVGIILIPTLTYGAMLLKCRFPVSERVAAGIPYREMLREAGTLGCLIVCYMVIMEINRVMGLPNLIDTTFFDLPSLPMTILLAVLTLAYLFYTRSLGRPMYIFLLLVMILLAITELGTDTWIKELMTPAMTKLGLDAGWVLVYTAAIMTILRFCITPIERALRPLGVLFVGSLFAAAGLYTLANAQGIWILIAATVYGIGQCFFWPVTIGLVGERFPKGGALTLNAIAGVGMLGVGILGSQLLGFWQDTNIDKHLRQQPAVYERVMDPTSKLSIFGDYRALDQSKVNEINDKTALYRYRKQAAEAALADGKADSLEDLLAADATYQVILRNTYNHMVREPGDTAEKTFAEMQAAVAAAGGFVESEDFEALATEQAALDDVTAKAKRSAMSTVTILPLIMAVCYLGLILYFRAKGGYKVIDLEKSAKA